MKRKLVIPIIGILNEFFMFAYGLSLVNGKIPFMDDKSVFVQFTPLVVSLVIAIVCELYDKEELENEEK